MHFLPAHSKTIDASTHISLFDMHQVSLHSLEQRELLESMDLAGVLEHGTQQVMKQFGSTCRLFQISLQVRSLVTLLKPQMAQQHQDSSGRIGSERVHLDAVLGIVLGRPCRTTRFGSTV